MTPRLGLVTVLPLYLAMATALGFVDWRARYTPEKSYTERIPAILAAQEGPPARYRILGPNLYNWLQRGTDLRPDNAWVVFRWLCLVAAFVAGHIFFTTWTPALGGVAGNAVVAILLPLTFTNPSGHPDDFLELCLFALGCACLARGWWVPFLIVLSAATFNRETSFLLVLVLAVSAPLSRSLARNVVVAAAIWLLVCVGLRWKLGYVGYDPVQIGNNWDRMFHWPSFAADRDLYYRLYGWFFIILLAGPAIIITRAWPAQPRFLRGALGVAAPIFVVIGLVFSSIMEPRIFTPLLPLVAAGIVVAMFEPQREAR